MAVKKEPIIESTVVAEDTVEYSTPNNIPQLGNEPAENIGGFCVYIGPSVRGVIQAGTVYGKPKEAIVSELSPIVKQYPQLASLIVSGDTLAVDRVKVKTPGNLLHILYEQLASGQKS